MFHPCPKSEKKVKTCLCPKCGNYPFAEKYCKWHQYMRTDKNIKQTQQKAVRLKARKSTGELELFNNIAEERGNFSEISGIFIYNLKPSNFHHILPKSKYPKLRLIKYNVIVLTYTEHQLLHFGNEKQREEYAEMMLNAGYQVDWREIEKRKEMILNTYITTKI